MLTFVPSAGIHFGASFFISSGDKKNASTDPIGRSGMGGAPMRTGSNSLVIAPALVNMEILTGLARTRFVLNRIALFLSAIIGRLQVIASTRLPNMIFCRAAIARGPSQVTLRFGSVSFGWSILI